MAKIGYLFLAKTLTTREEDLEWMKDFGCYTIIEEEGTHTSYIDGLTQCGRDPGQ